MATGNESKLNELIELYDLQTTYFKSALDGISDADRHNRLNTKANHIAWLAGSAVEQRYEMARQFGQSEKQQGNELFKDNKGIQDNETYPTLETYRADWDRISPILRDALVNATDEQLAVKIEMGPDVTYTVKEIIAFSSYREANIIGQIALWRRLLGYEGMKYM
ncbi:DinB family protein [Dyadobacter fanqingshengii]|uniref:DinB family protein n=1 Tax=Dyadobacter fanqingshengii TaxID=2906443 RepID=A0A9X1P930_9BACT|nr:DinB family protein [Dyadobacter fanqingshengii]MCF0040944.1 DinB family protein [Dyadobacter fanqingshengii]USJ37324.1 DinB family protein [Dyadobacter fanqingshengii]